MPSILLLDSTHRQERKAGLDHFESQGRPRQVSRQVDATLPINPHRQKRASEFLRHQRIGRQRDVEVEQRLRAGGQCCGRLALRDRLQAGGDRGRVEPGQYRVARQDLDVVDRRRSAREIGDEDFVGEVGDPSEPRNGTGPVSTAKISGVSTASSRAAPAGARRSAARIGAARASAVRFCARAG